MGHFQVEGRVKSSKDIFLITCLCVPAQLKMITLINIGFY